MRDTIDMAREAGAMFEHMMWLERDLAPVFQRFEALVRADEREACYTIAKFNQSNYLEHLTADQIKARGEAK